MKKRVRSAKRLSGSFAKQSRTIMKEFLGYTWWHIATLVVGFLSFVSLLVILFLPLSKGPAQFAYNGVMPLISYDWVAQVVEMKPGSNAKNDSVGLPAISTPMSANPPTPELVPSTWKMSWTSSFRTFVSESKEIFFGTAVATVMLHFRLADSSRADGSDSSYTERRLSFITVPQVTLRRCLNNV